MRGALTISDKRIDKQPLLQSRTQNAGMGR